MPTVQAQWNGDSIPTIPPAGDNTMSIKIYADPITINCRKVMAGMDLIGAPYELVHVDYFKGEQKAEPFVSLNPNASVPAMTDGAFELWESNAILQYAADKVGNDAVYPRDLQTRADIHRWLQWEGSHWFPSCYVFLVENCVKPLLGGEPDHAVLNAQAEQFHKLAGILDRRLAGQQWVTAKGPTLADVALAAPMHLHRHLRRWLLEDVERLPCWQKTAVYEGFTTSRPH
jgi:glutathione S-transferase